MVFDSFRLKRWKSKRGFTATEMIVTVAIIGILSSMTMPAVVNTKRAVKRRLDYLQWRGYLMAIAKTYEETAHLEQPLLTELNFSGTEIKFNKSSLGWILKTNKKTNKLRPEVAELYFKKRQESLKEWWDHNPYLVTPNHKGITQEHLNNFSNGNYEAYKGKNTAGIEWFEFLAKDPKLGCVTCRQLINNNLSYWPMRKSEADDYEIYPHPYAEFLGWEIGAVPTRCGAGERGELGMNMLAEMFFSSSMNGASFPEMRYLYMLDFSETAYDDDWTEFVMCAPALTRLHLDRTAITDETLYQLMGKGTKPDGNYLYGKPHPKYQMKLLTIQECQGVTKGAIDELRLALPDCFIVANADDFRIFDPNQEELKGTRYETGEYDPAAEANAGRITEQQIDEPTLNQGSQPNN